VNELVIWREQICKKKSPTFLTQCSHESINVHVGEVEVKIGDGIPFQFDSINELNVVREINKEDILKLEIDAQQHQFLFQLQVKKIF
jgi:hypothetical protein